MSISRLSREDRQYPDLSPALTQPLLQGLRNRHSHSELLAVHHHKRYDSVLRITPRIPRQSQSEQTSTTLPLARPIDFSSHWYSLHLAYRDLLNMPMGWDTRIDACLTCPGNRRSNATFPDRQIPRRSSSPTHLAS